MAMCLTPLSLLLLWWRQSDGSVLFLKVWEGRAYMYGNILLLRSCSQKVFMGSRSMYKGGVEGTVPTLQRGIWSQFNPGWTSSVILLFSALLPESAYCTVISTGMSHPTTTQPFKVLIKNNPIHIVTLYHSALALSLCYLFLTAPMK